MRRFYLEFRASILALLPAAVLFGGLSLSQALQLLPVTAKIQVVRERAIKQDAEHSGAADFSNVVVWLTPLGTSASAPTTSEPARLPPVLIQRNKTFEPHVLVVEVGTVVQFPNKDPFFHNIFSLFDGKRFDLGLYEAGTTRSVRFDRPGVSYLFCNIHAEMSAVVVVVETPYFAMSNRSGIVAIPEVPDGRYQLHVWYERSLPEDLKSLTLPITISDSDRNLGVIRVMENPNFTLAHKNKYGQDYVPPPSPGYTGP
jgi:plastocyanin